MSQCICILQIKIFLIGILLLCDSVRQAQNPYSRYIPCILTVELVLVIFFFEIMYFMLLLCSADWIKIIIIISNSFNEIRSSGYLAISNYS